MVIMEVSSVNPNEYDGPMPSTVAEFPRAERLRFAPEQPAEPAPDPRASSAYVAALSAALDMLAARLLGLIATVAACLVWGWTVYDPEPIRTYAAVGYSVTVLLPIILLYWRRG